jgi:hypothetical protein
MSGSSDRAVRVPGLHEAGHSPITGLVLAGLATR